jgi:hydroxymethylpyrimidine pyrophosphatase-like HAD family hydrolase
MIRFAGKGVAMANGVEDLRNAADYVTATNNEDGVARAIEKFVIG